MRPKDAKHHGTNPTVHHGLLTGLEHALQHHPEHESLPASWSSDLIDASATNWETDWIDLGGEG